MTRLYLRNNDDATLSETNSVALPVGTENSNVADSRSLELSKGELGQISVAQTTLAQTGEQSGLIRMFGAKWLTTGTIEANTWTIAFATGQSHANANAFTAVSLYVIRAAPPAFVVGYIYDDATPLGVEWSTSEDGQVFTVSGAEVGGVIPNDYLVCELWYVATQASATAYTLTAWYGGATDVTDSTTADAASYIETPQNLFPDPGGVYEGGISRAPYVRSPRV